MPYQKHPGILLDEKLNFKQHVDSAILKMNKGISVIKKLRHSLPRKSLLTIYKAFLRPLIDYGDIIYDQPQNESFCDKIESAEYKAALAITGAIQGTSRDKLNQELGLESLKSRRWYKRLCCMYKIITEKTPNYLINLIPKCDPTIKTKNNSIPTFHCRTDCFKYSFSPCTLNDWFSLDINIRNSESISLFKSKLLSFIRPVLNNMYIFDPEGLKFLTALQVGLSHLNTHRFHPNFQECLNPLYSCSSETEDTTHYLLHCRYFSNQHTDLVNSVNSMVQNFEFMSENNKKDLLLIGDSWFDENKNKVTLEETITFIKKSERFTGSLFE